MDSLLLGAAAAATANSAPVSSASASSSSSAAARLVHTFTLHKDTVLSLAVYEDTRGQFLFSGSQDSTIRVWRFDVLRCIQLLEGHHRSVIALKVVKNAGVSSSPNGQSFRGSILLSGGLGNSLRLWSCDTFSCLAVINEFPSTVYSLQVHGDALFCGCLDTSIRILALSKIREALANSEPPASSAENRSPDQDHMEPTVPAEGGGSQSPSSEVAADPDPIQLTMSQLSCKKALLSGHIGFVYCLSLHNDRLLSGSGGAYMLFFVCVCVFLLCVLLCMLNVHLLKVSMRSEYFFVPSESLHWVTFQFEFGDESDGCLLLCLFYSYVAVSSCLVFFFFLLLFSARFPHQSVGPEQKHVRPNS